MAVEPGTAYDVVVYLRTVVDAGSPLNANPKIDKSHDGKSELKIHKKNTLMLKMSNYCPPSLIIFRYAMQRLQRLQRLLTKLSLHVPLKNTFPLLIRLVEAKRICF